MDYDKTTNRLKKNTSRQCRRRGTIFVHYCHLILGKCRRPRQLHFPSLCDVILSPCPFPRSLPLGVTKEELSIRESVQQKFVSAVLCTCGEYSINYTFLKPLAVPLIVFVFKTNSCAEKSCRISSQRLSTIGQVVLGIYFSKVTTAQFYLNKINYI